MRWMIVVVEVMKKVEGVVGVGVRIALAVRIILGVKGVKILVWMMLVKVKWARVQRALGVSTVRPLVRLTVTLLTVTVAVTVTVPLFTVILTVTLLTVTVTEQIARHSPATRATRR